MLLCHAPEHGNLSPRATKPQPQRQPKAQPKPLPPANECIKHQVPGPTPPGTRRPPHPASMRLNGPQGVAIQRWRGRCRLHRVFAAAAPSGRDLSTPVASVTLAPVPPNPSAVAVTRLSAVEPSTTPACEVVELRIRVVIDILVPDSKLFPKPLVRIRHR